jgi:hypothetical protein
MDTFYEGNFVQFDEGAPVTTEYTFNGDFFFFGIASD